MGNMRRRAKYACRHWSWWSALVPRDKPAFSIAESPQKRQLEQRSVMETKQSRQMIPRYRHVEQVEAGQCSQRCERRVRWVSDGCLVALPLPTSAVVYKWVDENGKVLRRRPAGAHKQQVKVHKNPGATQSFRRAEYGGKTKKAAEAFESVMRRTVPRSASTKPDSRSRKSLKAHCEKMQKYLQQESSAKYLYRKDKDGNKLPVSDQNAKCTSRTCGKNSTNIVSARLISPPRRFWALRRHNSHQRISERLSL